jgi:3-hydroxyacyl-[acyl-carrier-protein] dehydratase
MQLKNNFFRVKSFCQTEIGFDYIVELNPEHLIYQAHFPEIPITPGVCIIQIVKELSEEIWRCNLFLKRIDNIKFLKVINPLENREVTFSFSFSSDNEDTHKISAVVHNSGNRFAKLSMLFLRE